MTQLSLATPIQREEIYRLRWMKPMSIMPGESHTSKRFGQYALRIAVKDQATNAKIVALLSATLTGLDFRDRVH